MRKDRVETLCGKWGLVNIAHFKSEMLHRLGARQRPGGLDDALRGVDTDGFRRFYTQCQASRNRSRPATNVKKAHPRFEKREEKSCLNFGFSLRMVVHHRGMVSMLIDFMAK